MVFRGSIPRFQVAIQHTHGDTEIMLAYSKSGVVIGVRAFPVDIEVDVSPGLPAFNMVGLPEGAVRESRERVKAAIKNSGYPFPTQKITVNLAPADIKKEGTGLDLPIAAAILCISGIIPQERLRNFCLAGELSLDGTVKSTRGVLPLALAARGWEVNGLIIPVENGTEAAVVHETSVHPAAHLSEIVEFLTGQREISPLNVDIESLLASRTQSGSDFQDVIGQEHAKRALEVAAAGGHNVIMTGPPGSGKTMLARRLPSILPPLTFEEALETTAIYSVAGLLSPETPLVVQRPFCTPHHTISDAGLIGGGTIPRPGQVSLAHNGVLFLDELPEFRKNVLEGLRQPLEDGSVTISRAAVTLSFPARFTLIAAQNPCPCGHAGDTSRQCSCTTAQIHRYRGRISGPLMDRIDIQMDVPAVPYSELSDSRRGETSQEIAVRVTTARKVQSKRFQDTTIHCNAQMSASDIDTFCPLSEEGRQFLELVATKLSLSARAFHRIIKISRTIADLAGEKDIAMPHLSEAVQYRSLDRESLL